MCTLWLVETAGKRKPWVNSAVQGLKEKPAQSAERRLKQALCWALCRATCCLLGQATALNQKDYKLPIAVNGRQFLGWRNSFALVSAEQSNYFHTLAVFFQTEASFVMVSGMM